MLGGGFAIADDCQQGGTQSGTSLPGAVKSTTTVNPSSIEDYSGGAGVGGTSSFSAVAIIDPEIVPYATPVADLTGTIAAITLSSDSTGYVPV